MMINKLSLFIAAFACSMVSANAAGLQTFEIAQTNSAPAISGAVWYPCAQTPTKINIGPFEMMAVKDCPAMGKNHPLIVISHGVGGSAGNFHELAETLADQGFIVAAISHPLDSGMSKIKNPGDIASMIQRPMDISRLIDFMFYNWSYGQNIDASRVGFFGFSRGAFTGLALLGGEPDWTALLQNCPVYPGNRFCEQIRSGPIAPMAHDGRIKAAVIADAPAGNLFTRDRLRNISVPVQYWASERGGDGVSPNDAAIIVNNLSVKAEYHLVPKTGHFDYLPPCTAKFAALTAEDDPELCTSKPGFDRAAFHKDFNARIINFFQVNLKSPS